MPRPLPLAIVKFEMHCFPVTESGCWLWESSISKDGYAKFEHGGKHYRAHRWAYENLVGPIPSGINVCHRCDVRSCVNPAHLFLGTQHDNMRDMHKKLRGARGETHGRHRLTEADVREIRKAPRYPGHVHELGRRYGISSFHVYDVLEGGRAWKHLDTEGPK